MTKIHRSKIVSLQGMVLRWLRQFFNEDLPMWSTLQDWWSSFYQFSISHLIFLIPFLSFIYHFVHFGLIFFFLAYFVGSLLHATLRIKFEGLQRIIIDPLFCHLGTFHPRLLSYILCCPIVHLWSFSKLFLSSYGWYIVTLSVIIFGLWF